MSDHSSASPLVSVITVTLNAARFLRAALESVAEQDYEHIEHLVFDGGSTDGTLELLRAFPRVHVHHGQDQGVADALNQALPLSRGQIITHLHADDRFAGPGAVRTAVEAFARAPEALWLYGHQRKIDAGGQTTLEMRSEPREFRQLLRRPSDIRGIHHQACFFRRELFDQVGLLDTSYKLTFDYEFILRAARTYPPLFVDEFLSELRRHPASLTDRHQIGVVLELLRALRAHIGQVAPAERPGILLTAVHSVLTVTVIPVAIKLSLGQRRLAQLATLRTRVEAAVPGLGRVTRAVLGY
jgi:glycosyltransferase involved in cell wall biosynthesis